MHTPNARTANSGQGSLWPWRSPQGETILIALGLTAALVLPLAVIGSLVLAGPSLATLFQLVLAAGLLAALFALAFTAVRSTTGRRRESEIFATLIDSVRDAVVRYESDGRVGFVSRSAETLFGCRRFEIGGAGLLERVHVGDRPAYLTALDAAGRTGERSLVEVRVRRDGSEPGYLWVEFAFSPVGGEGAQAREVIAVLRDVSARRDADLALERAHAAARDASDAKSRFLATIGHELRTPLNAIVGFSDMMEAGIGGTLSPSHAEYAGLIKQSGHHLLEIINMLLDMSKIEAGRFELTTEMVDPAALAEPCLHLVRKQAADRGITLAFETTSGLPRLRADERACRQILINLLSNAVKFSHDHATVTLSIRRRGAAIGFCVTDTGIGMSPQTVKRLGEPFYQAQDGLARRYEGTGLGLSIVKGLVGLHQGRLDIASRSGQGTAVTVTLPISGPGGAPASADIEPLRIEPAFNTGEPWPVNEQKSAAR